MPSSPIAYAGFAIMLSVVAFVLWAGDRPAREAALITVGSWVLVALLQDMHAHHVPWASFAVDGTAAAGFIALAVRHGRAWLAFLAAFQLLNVSSYLAFALDPGLFYRSFVTLSYVWSLGVLGSLVAGVWVKSTALSPNTPS